MKRLVQIVTLISLVTISSGQLFAAEKGQFYLGIGAARVSVSDSNFDDSDNKFNFLAGWMFNQNFGLELGYYDLGDYAAGTSISNSKATTFGGVLSFPIERAAIYGKLGLAYRDTFISVGGVPIVNGTSSDAYAGVGVEFRGESIGVYLEYLVFDGDLEVDVIGLGLKARF